MAEHKTPINLQAHISARQIDALRSLGPGALVDLIERMVEQAPELRPLMAAALGGGSQETAAFDEQSIAAEVEEIYQAASIAIDPSLSIVTGLEPLRTMAEELRGRAHWRGAIAISSAIALRIARGVIASSTIDADLCLVLEETVIELAECLGRATDKDDRATAIEVLLALWDMDNENNLNLILDIIRLDMCRNATREERVAVARKLRKRRGPVGSRTLAHGSSRQLTRLTISLEWDTLPEGDLMEICSLLSLPEIAIKRLLSMGRVNEAIATLHGLDNEHLIHAAQAFVEEDLSQVIEPIMRARLAEGVTTAPYVWLREHLLMNGRGEEALDLMTDFFIQNPSMQGYQAMLALARELDKIDHVVATMERKMGARESVMWRIWLLLDAERIENAKVLARALLVGVEDAADDNWPIMLDVADAAVEDDPGFAIDLWVARVRLLIDRRNRESYAEAASLLLKVRAAHQQTGNAGAWRVTMSIFRAEFRRMRALQDEMTKAGLHLTLT